MKLTKIFLIPLITIIVLLFFGAVYYFDKDKANMYEYKDILQQKPLDNPESDVLNMDTVRAFELWGDTGVVSWNTAKYGRIYGVKCLDCYDNGINFYDRNASLIGVCGGMPDPYDDAKYYLFCRFAMNLIDTEAGIAQADYISEGMKFYWQKDSN